MPCRRKRPYRSKRFPTPQECRFLPAIRVLDRGEEIPWSRFSPRSSVPRFQAGVEDEASEDAQAEDWACYGEDTMEGPGHGIRINWTVAGRKFL